MASNSYTKNIYIQLCLLVPGDSESNVCDIIFSVPHPHAARYLVDIVKQMFASIFLDENSDYVLRQGADDLCRIQTPDLQVTSHGL